MKKTRKQWHRYFVEEISLLISENVDEDSVFVECGVKQGSSSVRMGQRLGIKGYLFDTWHGFPNFSRLDYNSDRDKGKMQRRVDTADDTYDACEIALKKHGVECEMVRGDILETVPKFTEDLNYSHVSFNIAMMHIDTDLYEPAKMSLGSFWGNVVEGGVVVFHDYGDRKWRGIKVVVDELVESDDDLYFYVFDKNKLSAACLVKGRSEKSEDIFKHIVDLDR